VAFQRRLTEIPSFFLRRVAGPALKRIPFAREGARLSMNTMFRVALLPFGRNRRAGVPREAADLVARTDQLNDAAERYFATTGAREFILGKPFSDEAAFPRHLISLGILLRGLRLTRRDIVLEFGAGSCWVSHFLNRYGCRTISVDVSKTALDMGREAFHRDPATNWDLQPEFLVYDGHRLPLADRSCTRIIVVDAFHHIPNQREILTEFHRVLADDGIVAMSEPGKGHADTEASRKEVAEYGVLENELVIEDVGALARACGFRAAQLAIASPESPWEIPAEDLGPFIQGKGFTRFWEFHSDALLASHYLLLYKGDPRPSTRQPKTLGARMRVRSRSKTVRTRAGAMTPVRLTLTNTADSRWLAAEGEGWTRLGAHLYRDGEPPELVDYDWLRAALPHDVEQHERISMKVDLPAIATPGTYRVDFDMVVEGVMWFGDRGVRTTTLTLQVEEPPRGTRQG
jgi:SAM-dependent methyltransferase